MKTVRLPDSIIADGQTAGQDRKLVEFLNRFEPDTTLMLRDGEFVRCDSQIVVKDRERFGIGGEGFSGLIQHGDGSGVWVPPGATKGIDPARARGILRFRDCWNPHSPAPLFLIGSAPNAGKDGDFIAALEAQHGLEFFNCVWDASAQPFQMPWVFNVRGDFLYVGGTEGCWGPLKVVNEAGTYCRKSGRQGLAIGFGGYTEDCDCAGLSFDGLDMADIRRSAVDLEPPGKWFAKSKVVGVRITNSEFHDYRLTGIAAGSAPEVSDVLVQNCGFDHLTVVSGNPDSESPRRHGWRLLGLRGDETIQSGGPVMTFRRHDDTIVAGCSSKVEQGNVIRTVDADGKKVTVIDPVTGNALREPEVSVRFIDSGDDCWEFWNSWPVHDNKSPFREMGRTAEAQYR